MGLNRFPDYIFGFYEKIDANKGIRYVIKKFPIQEKTAKDIGLVSSCSTSVSYDKV